MKYLFIALICGILTTLTLVLLIFLIDKTGLVGGRSGSEVIGSPIGVLIAAIINLTWYTEIKDWILK